jgi:hypothetical protein
MSEEHHSSHQTPADADPTLSPDAQHILSLGSPLAYTQLLVHTPGLPEAEPALRSLTPPQLLRQSIKSPEDAQGLLAALWLWHDWLQPAHKIAQQMPSPTGSLWHAIMHRREGDLDNSKYWYDRCAAHPSFPALAVQVAGIIDPLPADTSLLRLLTGGWNPHAFVDLVRQVADTPQDPRHAVAVRVQQLEWRILFDHCKRQAVT